MALSIQTTDIRLEYSRTPCRLEIETQNARLLYRQKHARVNITTEKPKVLIDQYDCFAEAGLKGNYDFTREAAQRAYRQVMEYIGKTASDGKALAAIENGGDPIRAIAVRDAYPQHEFGLGFVPRSRPKIEVTGSVNIDWERNWEGVNNGVEGTYTPGGVSIGFEPAKLSIYVKQYPSVDIRYESNIDVYI